MEERDEGSQSGEGQTEVRMPDYIVRQSFSRELGVADVCADTIKSPISRIFDGKFRTTVHTSGQHGDTQAVKVESWRTLQLDIQVRFLSLFLSPSTRFDILVAYLQNSSDSLIQYTPFKTHSPSSHSHKPCRSSHLTRAKRVSKSRCSGSSTRKHFHLFSSSISSASFTTQLRVA